jgi:RimJ/RimL family protein N-acetyltransferase
VSLDIVDYDDEFLECSKVWLRDPETARLTRTPPFTDAAQSEWFAGLAGRSDYLIWGVRLAGRPVGAFGLKHVDSERAEYWGYLGEKDLWGKGLGANLVIGGLAAAAERGLREVYLNVGEDNPRARRLYERLGFVEESRGGDLILMRRETSLANDVATTSRS